MGESGKRQKLEVAPRAEQRVHDLQAVDEVDVVVGGAVNDQRRGAGLVQVGLGTVIPDVLTHLHGAQFADHPRPQQKADEKGRQAGIDRPERDVTKDVENRKGRMQRI